MNHVDAEFEAKYGFCPVDCAECDRLDQEDTGTPEEQRAAAFGMTLTALSDLLGGAE
jgi:hypothetical protein